MKKNKKVWVVKHFEPFGTVWTEVLAIIEVFLCKAQLAFDTLQADQIVVVWFEKYVCPIPS